MHFGHPRTTTAFKNQNFLKIWVFQGFPYTRLGPDLVILSSFWGKKFQNPCKKCPSHGEKNLKIFLFFKNVRNFSKIIFHSPRASVSTCFKQFLKFHISILRKGATHLTWGVRVGEASHIFFWSSNSQVISWVFLSDALCNYSQKLSSTHKNLFFTTLLITLSKKTHFC